MLKNQQERELEKVNAFYLQKEAEVWDYNHNSITFSNTW